MSIFLPFSSYFHLIKRKNIGSFKFDLSILIEKVEKCWIYLCVLLVFLLINEILPYMHAFKIFDLKKSCLLVLSKKNCSAVVWEGFGFKEKLKRIRFSLLPIIRNNLNGKVNERAFHKCMVLLFCQNLMHSPNYPL